MSGLIEEQLDSHICFYIHSAALFCFIEICEENLALLKNVAEKSSISISFQDNCGYSLI